MDWSGFLERKGDSPGGSLDEELALLVDAGFTPAEALRAATSNPALFFGLSDSLGSIAAGKIADLVLLQANPLQDIRNTKRMVAEISDGRFRDQEALGGLPASGAASISSNSLH
jgi:imidazolonepropionase-like amidohydrolase